MPMPETRNDGRRGSTTTWRGRDGVAVFCAAGAVDETDGRPSGFRRGTDEDHRLVCLDVVATAEGDKPDEAGATPGMG